MQGGNEGSGGVHGDRRGGRLYAIFLINSGEKVLYWCSCGMLKDPHLRSCFVTWLARSVSDGGTWELSIQDELIDMCTNVAYK